MNQNCIYYLINITFLSLFVLCHFFLEIDKKFESNRNEAYSLVSTLVYFILLLDEFYKQKIMWGSPFKAYSWGFR